MGHLKVESRGAQHGAGLRSCWAGEAALTLDPISFLMALTPLSWLPPPFCQQQEQPCVSSTSPPQELAWPCCPSLCGPEHIRGARPSSETLPLRPVALGGGCSSELAGERDQVAPTAPSAARGARFTANLMQHVNKLASANWH